MGRILQVYVDDETDARLERAAARLGRPVEDLAECAVAEAALASAREAGELGKPPQKPLPLEGGSCRR